MGRACQPAQADWPTFRRRFAADLKRCGVLVATESLISDDRSVRVQKWDRAAIRPE